MKGVQRMSLAGAGLPSLMSFAATAEADDEGNADRGLALVATEGEWPLNVDRPNSVESVAVEVMPSENGREAEFGLSLPAATGYCESLGGRAIAFAAFHTLQPDCSLSAALAVDLMSWPTRDFGRSTEPRAAAAPVRTLHGFVIGRLPVGFPSRHSTKTCA
jgi:hypothetical protein